MGALQPVLVKPLGSAMLQVAVPGATPLAVVALVKFMLLSAMFWALMASKPRWVMVWIVPPVPSVTPVPVTVKLPVVSRS